jgi:hypothetical protein
MSNASTTYRSISTNSGNAVSRWLFELHAAMLRPLTTMVILVLQLWGCSYDTAPLTGAPVGSVTDPIGDTFGSGGTRWDVTALTITRSADSVVVQLDFATDVISPMSRDTNAVLGVVDFDVDQNASTGVVAAVDHFRPGTGSTGIRADYQLLLTGFTADSTVEVVDSLGIPTGRVKPIYSAKRITIQIPLALLGNDDGVFDAAAMVGTHHRPSDIIPDNGHLTVTGTRNY